MRPFCRFARLVTVLAFIVLALLSCVDAPPPSSAMATPDTAGAADASTPEIAAAVPFDAREAATPPPGPLNVVCVGESITIGSGASTPGGATSYPRSSPTSSGSRTRAGSGTSACPASVSTTYRIRGFLLDQASNRNHLVISEGLNDILEGPYQGNPQGLFDAVMSYANTYAAAGFIVTLCTLTGTSAFNGEQRADAEAFNDLIRTNGIYNVADVAADPGIGEDATTPSSFCFDIVHLTDSGYERLAKIVAAALDLEATATPVAGTYSPPLTESLELWSGPQWVRASTPGRIRNRRSKSCHQMARRRRAGHARQDS